MKFNWKAPGLIEDMGSSIQRNEILESAQHNFGPFTQEEFATSMSHTDTSLSSHRQDFLASIFMRLQKAKRFHLTHTCA
ncbi:unnamed protein product [Amoebophrya sp. A120]|nr:unnamed protein product [Amoebophrya sp. A120]|eukprot:GSA120T00013092001.1